MQHTCPSLKRRSRRGFTLIELLTVIAVIGVLAAILIPAIGGAKTQANKTSDRAEFTGYRQALISYRSEYRYWPPFLADGKAHDVSEGTKLTNFLSALTGRDINGDTDTSQNRRAKTFFTFGNNLERDETKLYDLSGRTDGGTVDSLIYVAVDHDNDGIIKTSDLGVSLPITSTQINAQVIVWSMEDDSTIWVATFDED